MSVRCPLGVIFAPIAVTTHLVVSTAPVPSAATHWHQTVAAARVSRPYCDITGVGLRLSSHTHSHLCEHNHILLHCTFVSQILMNV